MWVVRWGDGVGVGLSFDLFFSCRLQPPSAKVIGEIAPLQKDVGNIQDEWEFHIWVKLGRVRDLFFFHLLVWHIHQVHIDQTPGHAHRRLKAEIIEIFELDDRLLDKRRGVAWNKFGASYGLECDQSCFFFSTCHGARSCDQCEKSGRLRRM